MIRIVITTKIAFSNLSNTEQTMAQVRSILACRPLNQWTNELILFHLWQLLPNSILFSGFFSASFLVLNKFPVENSPSLVYLIHKVVPIITLALIAAVNGGISGHTRARRVLISLTLSGFGDWLICFKQ